MTHRIMLGVTAASDMGGSYSTLPDSVGVFGFDYRGHIVRIPDPNNPNDNPTLIYPNKWYAVEFMVQYQSASVNTVKIWVDGVLQMTRENYNDPYYDGSPFSDVQDTSWFGGSGSCVQNPETQYVWRDNTVISTSYIGPIPGFSNENYGLKVLGGGFR